MRYVKYVGLAHERQITAHDWRSVGIQGDTVVWSARNGFAVPLDQFSDDQLRKAIEADPGFIITGESEEFTPAPQTRDMTPATLEQTVSAPVSPTDLGVDGPNASTAVSDPSQGVGGRAPRTASAGKGSGSDSPS